MKPLLKTNEDTHKKRTHNIHLLQLKMNLDVIKKLETNSNNDTCQPYLIYNYMYIKSKKVKPAHTKKLKLGC